MKHFLVACCPAFACLVAPDALHADPRNLEGSWRLVSAEPALPVVYETAGVGFSGGAGDYYNLNVSGACNHWGSHMGFKSGGPRFYQGPVLSTQKHCPDARGDFDRAFGRALRLTDSMTITGDTLVTEGAAGKLIFERRR